ncbi:SDR family NAD(P)-dependent oxidoreductase [Duganella sp. Root198D2]|uniref:SDR family NAD(P)-dependent oxidoreductase n=1 Tax=Duganella sp. Root198D2 TaxID=1736489 RepID=UPI00070D53B9|nr:SDR family NAD(P)-dependent oxidoreductase [Duganella sp. Root198D2]KRB83399.1 short-chain dehydrogenase [Duganella sp. Root198D2]
MSAKKKIVIVGATSAMAEHCARLWAAGQALDLTLLGRNREKTEAVAADLRVRSPQSTVSVIEANFSDPQQIRATVDGIVAGGVPEIVLVAHGTLPDQQACQDNLAQAAEAMDVNGISPALFAEAFAGHMQRVNRGTLTIISSVAGERGRKSNYVYGAAKGLVTRYAEGLQHRLALAGSAVKVVLVKPGPTATPMTAHMPQRGMASVESVAAQIVAATAKGQPVLYAPGKWALIMLIIANLPRFVFNRMDI